MVEEFVSFTLNHIPDRFYVTMDQTSEGFIVAIGDLKPKCSEPKDRRDFDLERPTQKGPLKEIIVQWARDSSSPKQTHSRQRRSLEYVLEALQREAEEQALPLRSHMFDPHSVRNPFAPGVKFPLEDIWPDRRTEAERAYKAFETAKDALIDCILELTRHGYRDIIPSKVIGCVYEWLPQTERERQPLRLIRVQPAPLSQG